MWRLYSSSACGTAAVQGCSSRAMIFSASDTTTGRDRLSPDRSTSTFLSPSSSLGLHRPDRGFVLASSVERRGAGREYLKVLLSPPTSLGSWFSPVGSYEPLLLQSVERGVHGAYRDGTPKPVFKLLPDPHAICVVSQTYEREKNRTFKFAQGRSTHFYPHFYVVEQISFASHSGQHLSSSAQRPWCNLQRDPRSGESCLPAKTKLGPYHVAS